MAASSTFYDATLPLLDEANFQTMKELMEDAFPEMLEQYVTQSMQYIASIHQGIAGNDLQMVRIASHTLKSSSAQLGFMRISDIARAIEHSVREAQTAAGPMPAEMHSLGQDASTVFEETKRILSAHGG